MKKIIDFIIRLFSKKREVKYTKTYSYLDFEQYVTECKCSYYLIPTNIEKVKLFNGELVDTKEGCKIFDVIVSEIFQNKDIKEYIKWKK